MSHGALFKVAQQLAARLEIYKKVAGQARDRGDTVVELDIREMWEPSDQAALDAFNAYVHQTQGRTPLPFEQAAATAEEAVNE